MLQIATSTSNKGVTSSDSALHSNSDTNDKPSLQNGTNLSSDVKSFSDNAFAPSMLNYALTSTSSPSSQTSSIPESELVLDSSSGLLVKKSDEIRSSDSPTIEINGINCNLIFNQFDNLMLNFILRNFLDLICHRAGGIWGTGGLSTPPFLAEVEGKPAAAKKHITTCTAKISSLPPVLKASMMERKLKILFLPSWIGT